MPTINTFQDPRWQAVADYMSVLQYQRLQSEIRDREREQKRQQLTMMAGGALVGGLAAPALGLGAQVGSTVAGAPIMGATLGGTLQGAGFGAQAGAQFGGGDIAGGAATVAGIAGQGAQRLQDIQQFGFAPTPLDKKEISKLATSLGTTTRAFTAQAKQAGMQVGEYAAQLAQEQQDLRMQNVFEGQMAQQLGVSPDVIAEAGQGDFQMGVERVRGMRQDQRLQEDRAQAGIRLNAALQKAGILNNFDIVPDEQTAHEAVRNYNAVMGDPNVPNEQRLEILNRIAGDIEDPSNFPMKLVRKQKMPFPEAKQFIDGLALEPGSSVTMKVPIRGEEVTVRRTAPTAKDTGEITPKDYFELLLKTNTAQSRALVMDVPLERTKAFVAGAAQEAGIQLPVDGAQQAGAVQPAAPQAPPPQQPQPEQAVPDPNTFMAAAQQLDSAIQQAPDVKNWPPEVIEFNRESARAVVQFLVASLKAGQSLDEDQRRIFNAAREILER
jgi:hypothetical protein